MRGIQDKLIYSKSLIKPYKIWRAMVNFGNESIRHLSNPYKNNSPIFLVGCGRSGTSMLMNGLGKSYKVELYNEDHPAAFTKFRLKDFSTIEQLTDSGYAQFKLYKPILDTHMAGKFLNEYPRAKIIFIYRHYSDVINSSIRYFATQDWPSRVDHWMKNDFVEFSSEPPPQETKKYIRSLWTNKLSTESSIALYWLFYNRLYVDLGLEQEPNVVLLNYENVVTKPNLEFRSLCGFLNIRYSRKMTEGIFASSIRKAPPPKVEETIQNECDELWDYLCGKVN